MLELISTKKKKEKKKSAGREWRIEHSPQILASEEKATTTTWRVNSLCTDFPQTWAIWAWGGGGGGDFKKCRCGCTDFKSKWPIVLLSHPTDSALSAMMSVLTSGQSDQTVLLSHSADSVLCCNVCTDFKLKWPNCTPFSSSRSCPLYSNVCRGCLAQEATLVELKNRRVVGGREATLV